MMGPIGLDYGAIVDIVAPGLEIEIDSEMFFKLQVIERAYIVQSHKKNKEKPKSNSSGSKSRGSKP